MHIENYKNISKKKQKDTCFDNDNCRGRVEVPENDNH